VPLHCHDKDQIIVSLATGKIRMIPPDGEPRVSEGKVGRAVFVPRGALHGEEFFDGTPRAIAVQLKR
jgi:oxalate decarboxylase/phosphoglucose isomerase-like protein (cupin superfamily)